MTCYRLEGNICNHIPDKRLIYKINGELSKVNIKNQTIQLEDGQNILTDISPKNIYRWEISTRKMFHIINH